MPLLKNSEVEKEQSEYIINKDVSVTPCSPNCLLTQLSENARVVRTGQTSATELTVILDSDHLLVPLSGSPRSCLHVLGEQQSISTSKSNWKKLLELNHPSLMKVFRICDCMAEVEICRGDEFEDVGTTPKWKKLRDLTDKVGRRMSYPYPFVKWKDWMSDLAEGLAELERIGIAHGDPYPFNAILEVKGAKWLDFSHLSDDPFQINKDAWAFILFTVIHTHRNTDFFSKSLIQQLALCLQTKKGASIFGSISEALSKDYPDLEVLTDGRQPSHYFSETLGKVIYTEANQSLDVRIQELLVKTSSQYFSDFLHHLRKGLDHVVAYQIEKQRNRLMEREMIRLTIPKGEYERAIVERDDQIATLKQTVADRDAQIAEFEQTMANRDSQLESMSHTLHNERLISARLFDQLNTVLGSRSWQLTRIPRVIARTIRNGGISSLDQAALFEKAKHLGRKLPIPMQLKIQIRSYLYWKLFYTSNLSHSSEPERGQKSRKSIATGEHNWILGRDDHRSDIRMRPEYCALEPNLVSVILPVYNQASLLPESIESVLAQSYQNFELIILNDGSTDDVENILCNYLDHPKIRIYTQANQKLPKALSNAFDLAKGEYWTWTSADNLMEPRQLELLVKRLNDSPTLGMVYADYYAIDDRGQPLKDSTWRAHNRPNITSGEIRLPRTTEILNTIQDNFIGACFMYRGWIGRVLGEYDPIQGIEDYDYWMRINNLFSIEHLGTDNLLYRYRVHDNTLNARAAEERILEKVQQLMQYEKERSTFYHEKLSFYVDTNSLEWFDGFEFENMSKHSISELDQTSSNKNACLIISADTLRQTPKILHTVQPLPLIVLFNSDSVTPYDVAPALKRPGIMAAVGTPRDALRVRAVSKIPVIDAVSRSASEAIEAFAKNFLFYEATRKADLRRRICPTIFVPKNAKKKVILQADNFTQGGMENVMIDLACTLKTKNIETRILVLGKGGDFVEKAKQLGLGIDVFNGRLDKEGYLSYLRQNKIDVVNAHYSVFGADIAHKLGIPFIQTIHNSYVWLDQNEIEKYRQCDALTSLYTCVSLSVAKYTDYVLGLDVSKMHIIPNGIDQSIFADICPQTERERLRAKWGIDETNKVFLNVASILATKAQLPLVRAFSQIVKSHPNARLVLLGAAIDEAYEKKIREFLRSSKLEQNVIFTGYDRKVAGYYYAADIFVLPSFWEGWSLSFGEALFTGIPIVSTNVGAAQEFEDIENVMLVSPPFGDVINLNSLNLAKYVYGNDEDFIARLCTALDKAMTLDRIPVNSNFHQQLDRAKAYEAYSELFLSVH